MVGQGFNDEFEEITNSIVVASETMTDAINHCVGLYLEMDLDSQQYLRLVSEVQDMTGWDFRSALH